MPINRIVDRFDRLSATRTGALIPYFTAGFPDLETTAALIRRADALGAAVVEIGVPFSDSIADGPVIQHSFHEVLQRGQRVDDSFQLAACVRDSVDCGLVVMLSYSIVYRIGLDRFMRQACESGLDGVILPDVPVEESTPMMNTADRYGLCHIGLVAPTTSPARRRAIAQASSGFLYRMAVAGTTGERQALDEGLAGEVAELRSLSNNPVCVGFGISTAEHVRQVCSFADGAIVGSAIIRRIREAYEQGRRGEALVDSVCDFLAELMAGLTPEHF